MKIALHACCAPCLLEPYDALVDEAESVTVVYWNPNIHPVDEYERRRDTVMAYAAEAGIDVVELPYDPATWLAQVGPHAGTPKDRCAACYEVRLTEVARWASEGGYDAMATTLTVSPYQDAEAISEAGERAAAERGLVYLKRDFRDRYPDATRRSRELQMYRQNYCGCLMSEMEARDERDRRRSERAAKKGSRPGGEDVG